MNLTPTFATTSECIGWPCPSGRAEQRTNDNFGRDGRTEEWLAGRRSGRWQEFMEFQVDRARKQYALSEPGIRQLPPGGPQLATWLMRELYAGILDPIESSGYDVFSRRHSLSWGSKLWRGLGIWWKVRGGRA
ncbi:MAG: hypothetical protein EBV83_03560 [Verrucomicrobia bacterium]|nr:hypothetical protein [Verrucomicrobiota bacterium]